MMQRPPTGRMPPEPRPIERVWSVERDGRRLDCELRANLSGAWDCQFFDEDWMIFGYRSASRRDALAMSEQQLEKLLLDGWIRCRRDGSRAASTEVAEDFQDRD